MSTAGPFTQFEHTAFKQHVHKHNILYAMLYSRWFNYIYIFTFISYFLRLRYSICLFFLLGSILSHLQLPIDKCHRSSKITYDGSWGNTLNLNLYTHTLFTWILQPYYQVFFIDETSTGQQCRQVRVKWNFKETNRTQLWTQGANREESNKWKQ